MSPTNVSPLDSGFTTQGALSSLTARPTNNIVNTNSFYDIVFVTAASGAIKTIQVTFPVGTTIPSGAFFNEAEGIGPGTASKSGQTITYTVTNAVSVPAGTKIRLEFANINNPLSPSANYKVTITTTNAANGIIDGPTQSRAYTMKQIGANVIADGSITSTKPAESFMKRVTLLDNPSGNTLGWNPSGGTPGSTDTFTISEASITGYNSPFFIVEVRGQPASNHLCDVMDHSNPPGTFKIVCFIAPPDGSELHYTIGNLPPHPVT